MIIKLCGIYKILNIITRDYYLGSAVNFHNRWSHHRSELRRNIRGNTHFQNAWNKYGEQSFEFSIVLLCDIENRLYYEDVLIKGLKPAYNIATNALASMQGRHHSEETCARISEAQIGNTNSLGHIATAETRAKMSIVQAGRHPSEESRAKMSVWQKGKPNGRLGYRHTEETLAKMSKARMGKCYSAETRAKMSVAHKDKPSGMLGKHHTKETRAKMCGRVVSDETRAKLSEITTLQWAKKKENTE